MVQPLRASYGKPRRVAFVSEVLGIIALVTANFFSTLVGPMPQQLPTQQPPRERRHCGSPQRQQHRPHSNHSTNELPIQQPPRERRHCGSPQRQDSSRNEWQALLPRRPSAPTLADRKVTHLRSHSGHTSFRYSSPHESEGAAEALRCPLGLGHGSLCQKVPKSSPAKTNPASPLGFTPAHPRHRNPAPLRAESPQGYSPPKAPPQGCPSPKAQHYEFYEAGLASNRELTIQLIVQAFASHAERAATAVERTATSPSTEASEKSSAPSTSAVVEEVATRAAAWTEDQQFSCLAQYPSLSKGHSMSKRWKKLPR